VFGEPPTDPGVSGEWRRTVAGSVTGTLSLTTDQPFRGSQSQRITFTSGSGRLGVDNRGLNRWGIDLVAGKPYEGYAYLRTSGGPTPLTVSGGGGGATVTVTGSAWKKYPFTFTPATSNTTASVAFTLSAPGTLDIGYAFVQPGSWSSTRARPRRPRRCR
jgi:hypothetical protein